MLYSAYLWAKNAAALLFLLGMIASLFLPEMVAQMLLGVAFAFLALLVFIMAFGRHKLAEQRMAPYIRNKA